MKSKIEKKRMVERKRKKITFRSRNVSNMSVESIICIIWLLIESGISVSVVSATK